MSRWVDADAVKEALKQNTPRYMWGEVLATVNVQPYIDLVRCGECKHWQDNNGGYPTTECRWGHDETPDADDFCSYGDKRDD